MVVRSDVKLISSRVRECTPRKNPHATFPRCGRAVGQSVGIGFTIENVDWLPLPICIWRDKLGMLSRFWTIRRSDKVFEIKIGLQKKGLHDIVGERVAFLGKETCSW